MAVFGISGADPLGSTRELINYQVHLFKYYQAGYLKR
jgi:hypothetical protein